MSNPFAAMTNGLGKVKAIDVTEAESIITPEIAAAMLERNTHNRPIKKRVLRQYTKAMIDGEWNQNGQIIGFNKSGELVDGQHRLMAVVKSGVSIPAVVVVGLSDSAQETMDVGAKRSFSDMLALRGEVNANTLAAAVRMIWAFDELGTPHVGGSNDQPSAQKLFKKLDETPQIRDVVRKMKRSDFNTPFFSASVTAAFYVIFCRTNDEEDVSDFFFKLATGAGLEAGSPIHMLRERLLADRTSGGAKLPTLTRYALLVKAFNAYVLGVRIGSLRWRQGGAKPEAFPTVASTG